MKILRDEPEYETRDINTCTVSGKVVFMELKFFNKEEPFTFFRIANREHMRKQSSLNANTRITVVPCIMYDNGISINAKTFRVGSKVVASGRICKFPPSFGENAVYLFVERLFIGGHTEDKG